MKINRCIYCMEEMGEGAAVCPYCGKKQEPLAGYDGRRANTILHGRYLIGMRKCEEAAYIAFDLARGKRTAVKEFYVLARYGMAQAEWNQKLGEILHLGSVLLQQPDHLILPRVQEVFQEDGTAFMALDPPGGNSVAVPVTVGLKNLPPKGAAGFFQFVQDVLRPSAESVTWLHQAGLLHRNIKADGITWLADEQGVSLRLPLPLLPSETRFHPRGIVSGPVYWDAFTPMEEYNDKTPKGPWTDVYALCAVLYLYVTGQEPPEALNRMEQPSPLPGLPPELSRSQRAVLEDGLALRPEDRIQSVDELLRRAEDAVKDPGGFDLEQNITPTVYGPPPQPSGKPETCPHCHFQWTTPAMVGKPTFCPHCGKKLKGGFKLWGR